MGGQAVVGVDGFLVGHKEIQTIVREDMLCRVENSLKIFWRKHL